MVVTGMGPHVVLVAALGVLVGVGLWFFSDLADEAVGTAGASGASASEPTARADRRVMQLRAGLAYGRPDRASLVSPLESRRTRRRSAANRPSRHPRRRSRRRPSHHRRGPVRLRRRRRLRRHADRAAPGRPHLRPSSNGSDQEVQMERLELHDVSRLARESCSTRSRSPSSGNERP